MTRRRPDYIAERVALSQARRWARKNHAQPCDCPDCTAPERTYEIIRARLAAERERIGEPPF